MGICINALSDPEVKQAEVIINYRNASSLIPANETLDTINPEERDVVNIINEYNDRNLFKLFSKDKSVKDFLYKHNS